MVLLWRDEYFVYRLPVELKSSAQLFSHRARLAVAQMDGGGGNAGSGLLSKGEDLQTIQPCPTI